MGRMMRRDEHHGLVVTETVAEHMACTGLESSAKQARHDVNGKNTIVVMERAGQPLQGLLGFSVISQQVASNRAG